MLARFVLCAAIGMAATSGAAELFVAPNGNDTNPGTKDRPLATLGRARDLIRQQRQAGTMKESVTVNLRAGTYYLPETLVFDSQDSGSAQAPVVYQAFGGEAVVLSGGSPLSGWRQEAPGRWTVTLPDVAAGRWNFSQLYLDDQRRPRAYLPKQGYYYIERTAAPTKPPAMDRFIYREGDIRPDWHNLTQVEILTFHLWTMDRIPIAAVDAGKRLVTLAGPTHSHLQAPLSGDTWYRVENVKEALTEPGEWYLDRATGQLAYLAKPGEDLSRATVVAPRLTRLVDFRGDVQRGDFVDHITFRNITFAHSAWNVPAKGYGHPQADADLDGAITGINARHCSLESCVVRHTGAYAVDFRDGCQADRVEGCELFDLGGGGVKIGPTRLGYEADRRKWAGQCIVRNNLIVHGGRSHPASVGVWIGHAADNVIEHNEIDDFYYSALSIGWEWGHRDSAAHHNRIEYNRLSNLGQGVLSDMGGIYLLGHAPGTVVRGNVMHDINRARYGGWGVYLDACSAQVLVENNLAYRTEDGGLHQNYGHDNTIRNNIFVAAKNRQLNFNSLKNGVAVFERNIVGAPLGNRPLANNDDAHDKNQYRRNLYWPAGAADQLLFPGKLKLDQWRGREPDAVVADPLFVDAAHDDYRLKPQSPAIALGFVPFDPSAAGRTTKARRTDRLPPVARVFPPAPPPPESPAVLIDDDFESSPEGKWAATWPWHLQLAEGSPQSFRITQTAAQGKHGLEVVDTPDGASYFPHAYIQLRYTAGVVRNRFDLRIEPGAHFFWQWRDWPSGEALRAGPALEVRPDGALLAGGQRLLVLPHGQWSRLEITCGVGDKADGTFCIEVTLPGEKTPHRVEKLRYPPGFRNLTWAGFVSVSSPRGVYHIDNFLLTRTTN